MGSKSQGRNARSLPSQDMVVEVCRRLRAEHGSPRLGNPRDPLDDLIFILVSNRTGPVVATRVYEALRTRVGRWNDLGSLRSSEFRRILAPAGLVRKRTAQLRGIAARLTADFGRVTLDHFRDWCTADIEAYLSSLPGVSTKVAKCVLLYGCDRRVLPVDVHVHRVSQRLGWHKHRRADQSHATLEALVRPSLRYGFHTNAIAHGRAICRPKPLCDSCVLIRHCQTGQRLMSARAKERAAKGLRRRARGD